MIRLKSRPGTGRVSSSAFLFFLALDLGVFHRRPRAVKFREAAAWSALWFALAMLFAACDGSSGADARKPGQFTTGYVIELSLSLDNILVIALIFAWFRVPAEFQHRCSSGASSARSSCAAR